MASLNEVTNLIAQNFSLADGLNLLKPLGLFILGLAVYAWFIFKFYRFLAKKEIFKLNIHYGTSALGKFFHSVMYVVKYLIIFPLFLLFWVLILTVILAFLAKNNDIQTILLISVALVAVVRLTAYYDEDLSKDLAKMMPFALLGVFLVDISYFSTSNAISSLLELANLWRLLVYYLIILILLELILRILYMIFGSFAKDKSNN